MELKTTSEKGAVLSELVFFRLDRRRVPLPKLFLKEPKYPESLLDLNSSRANFLATRLVVFCHPSVFLSSPVKST